MDDARTTTLANDRAGYRGLRDWIEKVDDLGDQFHNANLKR